MTIALLILALALEPFVASDPVIHVLIQMPALAAAGYLLVHGSHVPVLATGPLLILTLTTALIWMLPRSVDAALTGALWQMLKFATLPLCLGVPLALAWARLGPITKGFIKAKAISMALFLGFLYTHAPLRLCNSYLVSDQVRLGVGFVAAACLLIVIWIIPAFVGTAQPRKRALP